MPTRDNDPLEAANELRELILEHRDETERARQLSAPIVAGLIEHGLGRMALPAELGGLETPPADMLAVYETLAEADASVAWIAWNSSLSCWFGRFLGSAGRETVFGEADALYASSARPTGRAAIDGDDFRVSGRWTLVSGCKHAAWIAVMAPVEKDGEVKMLAPGVPDARVSYVPASACRIVDTWHSGGLRGTGSHDVVLEDERVPGDLVVSLGGPARLDGPLARMPIGCTMAAGCASISLGIAEASLRALLELADKPDVMGGPGLPTRPTVQSVVGRVATELDALRSNLREKCAALWQTAVAGDPPSAREIGALWSASIVAGSESRSAVTDLYSAAGASSLYTSNRLERAHRDIHAVNQHILAQRFWLEQAGQALFGMTPPHPLFAL